MMKKTYDDKILEELGVCGMLDKEMPLPIFMFKKVFPYLRSKNYEFRVNDVLGLERTVEKEDGELNSVEFKEELECYSEEDFGFLKHDGQYYAYLKVPAFAIKSAFDGRYYFFEKTEVAVLVKKDSNEIFRYSEGLYITKNNGNPLFHGRTEDFTTFCIGVNHLPFKGNDLGEVIAQRLRKGKYIFLYSYLKPNLKCDELRGQCRQCGKNHFEKHVRLLEELEEMEVQFLEGKGGVE